MKIILCLFIFSYSSVIFARGGDEVRNGGGLAENYLAYALLKMDAAIDFCLNQNDCAVESVDRRLLEEIKKSLPEERRQNILKFSSENERPGFFVINGFVRLAVTGNQIGDPVYFNLDLLYSKGDVRMNFGQALQSLVHELGHHHNISDHAKLEALGAKVRRSFEGSISDVPFMPSFNSRGFSALGIETKSALTEGSLSILFKDKSVDLTSEFLQLKNKCKPALSSEIILTGSSLQFFNLSWEHSKKALLNSERILRGNSIIYCSYKNNRTIKKYFNISISVKVTNIKGYEYVNHSVNTPVYLFDMEGEYVLMHEL